MSNIEPTYKLEGDRLVPAFPDLDPNLVVRDVASVGGKLYLLVWDGTRVDRLKAIIVTRTGSGYQTLVTAEDISRTDVYLWNQVPEPSLAVVGDTLFLAGLSLVNGQLRAQRGSILPGAIDTKGRFGASNVYASYGRGPLFTPSWRVRKNLAAVADTTGFGGVHYRSELTVANFSTTSPAVARVYVGAGTTQVMEVPLSPGVQMTIEDPLPDFVGPMAVEFDGLTDERDAWAAVRVFSAADGGTAGTSLVGTDPGSLPHQTAILPPVPRPGTRTHLAVAASGDGPQKDIAFFVQWQDWSLDYLSGTIPNGSLRQMNLPSYYLTTPLRVTAADVLNSSFSAQDDLLGYIVRNEQGTNDGTIVPFEPPDTLPGRRTRFLPAVVGITSQFGQYRTELSLGWSISNDYPPSSLDFSATYRDGSGSWTFSFSIGQGKSLSVDDVGSWLAGNGVTLNPSNFVGTLSFSSDRPEGAADLLVTAVVLARGPGASGDYGVSVPVVNEVQWAQNEAIVPGLREDAAFRSNIAVANPEPDGGPSVTLSVSLRRASDGAAVGTLAPVTLKPGQRFQFDRPLRAMAFSGDAYADVQRIDGTGRFVALRGHERQRSRGTGRSSL